MIIIFNEHHFNIIVYLKIYNIYFITNFAPDIRLLFDMRLNLN